MFAYVGCYTTPDRDGRGKGIVAYRMDPASGAWSEPRLVAEVGNPSFLTTDSRRRFLYTVHGGDTFSEVSAFRIDQATGSLAPLGTRPCGGPNPVAVAIERTDRYVAVANYANGTVGSFSIQADGSLSERIDLREQTGPPGPHPTEQRIPHPHHVLFDPSGTFLVVPDKGLDRTYVYRIDLASGKIPSATPPFVQARPGAAPRHVVFHPTRPLAYVINELDSTVTTYRLDVATGALEPLQVLPTVPPDFQGRNTTAEIMAAPSGRFIYGSNRGHDSIVTLAVSEADGTLEAVAWEPTQGRTPRFFALDPSGSLLYAANQASDSIVTFRVDQASGRLAPTGQVIQTGSPVTIVFAGS
ncbi:MAG: lactonase family protein [Chloroflexota bacterium]